ncbi:ATP-binding protein [Alkalihalobacillus sp. NPDC078783]
MRFQTKLMLLIFTFILFIICILGVSSQKMIEEALEKEIGQRALDMAETVAINETVLDAFQSAHPAEAMYQTVNDVFEVSEAEFITIANEEGIRYYHPEPSRIGKPAVGGDNEPVLQEGRSIISKAEGSLGLSIRGKAPVVIEDEIVGFVSVGFLAESINATALAYERVILFVGLGTLGLGAIGTFAITKGLKRATLGLEPKEIGRLYEEKQAIVESVGEGLLAMNEKNEITLMNGRAKKLLRLDSTQTYLGRALSELIHSHVLSELLVQGDETMRDREAISMARGIVVQKVPIKNQANEWIGTVFGLRDTSDFLELTEKLSQTEAYADALRAQTHEFSNKLHVLSGLLQLESYQEAIEYINAEAHSHNKKMNELEANQSDAWLQALLIGKQHQAEEKGIEWILELPPKPIQLSQKQRQPLLTVLGNIIDNAIDSVLKPEAVHKKIHVTFSYKESSMVVSVDDWGIGFGGHSLESIIQTGYSSKTEGNHGYGMRIVQSMVRELNGTFTAHSKGHAVTTIEIIIPLEENEG